MTFLPLFLPRPHAAAFPIAAVAVLLGASSTRADHADRAQCTCEPAGSHYSGITNGQLCVLTPGGGDPYCNIQVYCLSDGSGSGCDPHAAAMEAAEEAARSGDLDLDDFLGQLAEALGDQVREAIDDSDDRFGRLLAALAKDATQMQPCFAALAEADGGPISVDGDDSVSVNSGSASCRYDGRFHVLTLRPSGPFRDGGFPAIQIVAPQ